MDNQELNKINLSKIILEKEKIKCLTSSQIEYILSCEDIIKSTFDELKKELIARIKNKSYNSNVYELKENKKRVIKDNVFEILKENNINVNRILDYKIRKISELEKIIDQETFNKIYDVIEYKPFLCKKINYKDNKYE